MREERHPNAEFLSARRVLDRYGVSDMTLYRWLHDKKMQFPQPCYFGRLRFWRLGDLENWERAQIRGSGAPQSQV